MNFPVIRLKTIDSTNKYIQTIKDLYRPQTFVVIAEEQTSGRGQCGNSWLSMKNMNLTFSLCVFPQLLKAEEQFMFNKVISLSVLEFLTQFIKEKIKIKWPNDIYIEDKKISGILIEHALMGDFINDSVAGIGININQCNFPDALPNPVSLKLITSKDYYLDECFEIFLNVFNCYYNKLLHHEWDSLNDDYLKCLYGYMIVRSYKYKDVCLNAKIIGVDTYGRLQLKDDSENFLLCNFKEIEFLY